MKTLPFLFLFCFFHLNSIAQTDASATMKHAPNEPHVLLILSHESLGNGDDMAQEVTRYNAVYFNEKGYTTKRYKMEYISSKPVIFVTGFENFDACKDYIKSIGKNKPNFDQRGMSEAYWPVSVTNFNTIVRNKDASQFENKILPSLLDEL